MSDKFVRFVTGPSSMYSFGSPHFKSREEQLEYELKITRERLSALTETPSLQAAVLDVDDKFVTVCTGPQTINVKRPPSMDIGVGDIVDIRAGDPPAIYRTRSKSISVGTICVVKQVVDAGCAEISIGPNSAAVYFSKKLQVEAGDRVVLDQTNHVIVRNLGRGDRSRFYSQDTGVSWEDIGGLEEAKKLLIEAIEEPFTKKELYKKYRRQPVRGILLYGGPGCGKTLLGKACATALAKLHGASAKNGGFIYVKGPDILNMFVGNSEANIRAIFSAAREHKKEHGYPAIVFIDEADAVMGKRGMRMHEGMERTIVPQFLAEMDGLEDAGCMVLLATNRPDVLDPAIVRPKRVDQKIHVRRPNREECENIFKIYLKGLPLAENLEEMAKHGVETLFDNRNGIIILRTKDGKDRRFGLSDMVSGALIDTIVAGAGQQALRREKESKNVLGLTKQDITASIKFELDNARSLDHTSELQTIVEDERLSLAGVEKIT